MKARILAADLHRPGRGARADFKDAAALLIGLK